MAKKILIVDDEPNIVVSLEFLMAQNGYQVFVARNGEKALYKIPDVNPDLIILDIMLPKKSGLEILQMLKNDKKTRGIKVILLSGKASDDDVKKGLELGACAYVTKPFSSKNLLEKVREVLGE